AGHGGRVTKEAVRSCGVQAGRLTTSSILLSSSFPVSPSTMLSSGLLTLMLVVSLPFAALAQNPNPGTPLRFSGVELSVGGRLQTQFATTSVDTVPPSELFIRRARLEVGIRVNEWVSG